ncbi:MAG: hypothetical protein KO253_02960 [Methanobrevibacter arboriphilus]|nr:hypothetical protein [Methanobrevibacter arboriphilus]
MINGVATFTIVGLANGIYTVNATYFGNGNLVCIPGILNVSVTNYLPSLDIYVATNGSDIMGNGSKENPFATIDKALQYGYNTTKNIFIHLSEGIYEGIGGNSNIKLLSNVNVTISGSGMNNTILRGNRTTWAFLKMDGECLSTIANLTITNYQAVSNGISPSYGIVSNMGHLILENCRFIDNQGSAIVNCGDSAGYVNISLAKFWGNLTIINSYFTNHTGVPLANYANVSIYGSVFTANNGTGYGSEIFNNYYNQNNAILYVENTSIMNTLKTNSGGLNGGGAVAGGSNMTFVNCYFTNNPYRDIGVFTNNARGFITIINTTFYNSSGGLSGYNSYFFTYNIINSTFENINELSLNGVYGYNTFNIIEGSIFKNITGGVTLSSDFIVANSSILTNLIINTNANRNYILNYNWWGSNIKPNITSGIANLNFTHWVIMNLVNIGNPGLIQNISVVPKVIDDNGNLYDYDISSIPIPIEDREFAWEVVNDTGSITPNEGNVSDSGFNSTFTGNNYGNHTVKAVFKNFNASKTFELYILGTITNVTVSNPKGKNGSTIIITANVKDNQGNPVNEGIVEFFFNGKSLGNATVNEGIAEFIWIVNEPNFNNGEVYAEYHENDAYTGSIDTTDFTVLTVPTNVTIDLSKVSGNRGDKVLITVNVRDNQGNPITSGLVEVYANGVYLGTFDVVDGKIITNWAVSGNPGKVNVMANYTDDYTYVDNQKTTNFEINKIKTSTSMSNSKGTYGKNTVLKATLKDANGKAVVGRYVKFYVNNKYVGQAKTNSQGLAALNYKVKNTGSLTIKAISVSDSTYQSSTRSSKLSVPKLSKVKIKNSYAVKGKKITFKTLLANFGPDKSSFVISYKLPKGVKLLKRSLSSGLVKYNKRTGILSWTVKNLKLSKSKSAILTVSLSAKKGKYYIKNSVKKSAGSVVYGNNALKNIKVK